MPGIAPGIGPVEPGTGRLTGIERRQKAWAAFAIWWLSSASAAQARPASGSEAPAAAVDPKKARRLGCA